jgi:hypothetical protein
VIKEKWVNQPPEVSRKTRSGEVYTLTICKEQIPLILLKTACVILKNGVTAEPKPAFMFEIWRER